MLAGSSPQTHTRISFHTRTHDCDYFAVRGMFFTPLVQALRGSGRRVPKTGYRVLNSKRGGRSLKKGRGARPTGYVDKRGHFQGLAHKKPDLLIPDLSDFPLKPYVAWNVTAKKGTGSAARTTSSTSTTSSSSPLVGGQADQNETKTIAEGGESMLSRFKKWTG